MERVAVCGFKEEVKRNAKQHGNTLCIRSGFYLNECRFWRVPTNIFATMAINLGVTKVVCSQRLIWIGLEQDYDWDWD